MKLRNRILSILMVLAMLASSMVVFAEDAVVEDTRTKMPTSTEKLYGKLALLEGLGLFEDMTALSLDEAVTRATFAGWLEKVANLTDEKAYKTTEFSDVPVENEQYDAIQKVVSAGYMSGMGGSVFMPTAAVSLTDAAASLVRLVGKEAYANVRGGYPTGYEVAARSIGLYDGVKTGVNTTVNVLVMIYNALRADYLAPEGLSSKGIIYDSGETVLSFFHNIYEVEGRMTANGYTKTYSDDVIYDTNTIEINKLVYVCNNSKVHDLIGRYVQGFYRYDKENDKREIISAYADEDDNTIFELESRALSTGGFNLRLVGLTLYYPIDGGAREKKIELKPGFDFIYNNRAVPTRLDSDILVPDGELTFIDSDNDRKYDIVIAKARQTERITGIDNYKTIVYTENMTIQRADYDSAVMIVEKMDKKKGTISEVTIDELTIGAVATVYRSHDGIYNEIITCEDSLQVVPTAMGEEDEIFVGETKYVFANVSAKADITIGLSVELYFDHLGRIAYVEKAANLDYAYALVFGLKEDMDLEQWTLKLFTPYGEKKYPLYDRVMVDGVSGKTPEEINTLGFLHMHEVIRYRLDSKGFIRGIDTLTDDVLGCNHTLSPCAYYDERHNKLTRVTESPNGEKIMYNQSGISFGTHAEYMIGRSTFTLAVPTNTAEKEDIKNYRAFLEGGDIGNRTISIYDWDPNTLEVGVVMQHISGRVGAPTIDRYSTVGVAKRVYRIWDDGEDVLKIDLINGGEHLTYTVADTIAEFQANTIGFGDVIAYELDAEGKFAAFNIEMDASETSPNRAILNTMFPGFSADFRVIYGRVIKKYASYAVVEPIKPDNAPVRATIPTTTISDLTLVDMSEKAITSVDKEYFSTAAGSTESPSYVYAMTYKNGSCQELVVYKY